MANIYDLSDTWNAGATVFTAIKMNVTDTASAAGSLLMDLQVGGASRFSVTKGGAVIIPSGGSTSNPVLQIGANANTGFTSTAAARISFTGPNGTYATFENGTGLKIASNVDYSWSDTVGNSTTSADLRLFRDAANTLAQRNGVNAQAFNLYNTYTDASNYERGFMRFVSNTLRIGTEKLGTGTARNLEFQTDGVTRLTIAAAGGVTFAGQIDSGNFRVTGTGNGMSVGGGFAVASSGALFGALIYNGGYIGFASSTVSTTSAPDLTLWRDAADTLALRNGTNAQTSRIYGTYTDAANYRRLTNTMSTAGVAEIKPEGAGTGASDNVLHISGLPTSTPGPGILWNNAGTPAIGT
jgi:hypothetical protein